MLVWRGTAAKKAEFTQGGYLVPCSRRNEYGVAGNDLTAFAVEFHVSLSLKQKIEFFAEFVVMPFRGLPSRQVCFGEALLLHRSIGPIENAADG